MGFFLWSLIQPQAFSNGCVPSDFPIYPASGWTGESFGDTDCRISQTTFDGADRVIDYYKGKLNGSKWTITSIDRSNRRIFFSHAHGATTWPQPALSPSCRRSRLLCAAAVPGSALVRYRSRHQDDRPCAICRAWSAGAATPRVRWVLVGRRLLLAVCRGCVHRHRACSLVPLPGCPELRPLPAVGLSHLSQLGLGRFVSSLPRVPHRAGDLRRCEPSHGLV
jgi:hypothetical protein